MSFATEIEEIYSNKIVLVEIDLPLEQNDFINYEAGIWFINLTPGTTTVTGANGEIGYYGDRNTVAYQNIGSLLVEGIGYTKVESIEDLEIQDSSFYYDNANTTLYIHFEDFGQPLDKDVIMGITNGFSTKPDSSSGAYYNDIFYDPRVDKIPSLTKKKDKLFFGNLQYQSGTITFANDDGYFETLIDKYNFYGQAIRVYLGFEEFSYAEFQQVYSGYIESYSYTFDKFTIQIQDLRKKLSRSLPVNKYTQSSYPQLKDDNINENIPIAYGSIKNAPTMCINENGSEPFIFKYMDTSNHSSGGVTAVYANGVDITGDVLASDNTAGTFNLSDVSAFDADDTLKEITCDFVGADGISNALDVVKDLILLFDKKSYIATNYNLTEWAAETLTAQDIGLYIKEDTPLNQVIESIMISINGIFFFQDDGKMTVRTYDEDRTPIKTIDRIEWLNDPNVPYPGDEFLTSIRIQYDKDQNEDKFLSIVNSLYENDTQKIFKQYKQKTIDTLLTNSTDAQGLAEEIMNRSKTIAYHVDRRKTKLQNIDLEIMDFIIADVSRNSIDLLDIIQVIFEVVGITKDLSKNEIILDLIYVDIYNPDESNNYFTQGNPYTDELTLDKNNSLGGVAISGTNLYDSTVYDARFYSYTGHYDSQYFYNSASLSRIQFTGYGDSYSDFDDIEYQYREADSIDRLKATEWSSPASAIGSKEIFLTKKFMQIRFIFNSPSWHDNDRVVIQEVV